MPDLSKRNKILIDKKRYSLIIVYEKIHVAMNNNKESRKIEFNKFSGL